MDNGSFTYNQLCNAQSGLTVRLVHCIDIDTFIVFTPFILNRPIHQTFSIFVAFVDEFVTFAIVPVVSSNDVLYFQFNPCILLLI